MELQRATWVLAAAKTSVPEARALVERTLDGLPSAPLEVVLLLTSELVTNAVRHGSGPVGLRLAWDDRQVRVEVEDASPERPVVRAIDRSAPDGRGLMLIDALSEAWGVEASGPGKTVWFALRLPGDVPSADAGR